MNELGWNLVWAAARVTIITGAAMLAYFLAAVRSPTAAARLSMWALAISVLITAAAFFPALDLGITHGAPAGENRAYELVQATPDNGRTRIDEIPSRAVDSSVLATLLGNVAGGLRQLRNFQPAPDWRWPKLVALVFVFGVVIGWFRLAIGIWSVHALHRRSRPATDTPAHRMLQALSQDMKVRRPVDVRISEELTTAATIGWRRPCILLPASWRSWTERELRTVLAHELSHIQHCDYPSGLLARWSVALHFYHPAVHWLAGRLRLQQELAADALAARFAGGREGYLAALARLALKQDGPSLSWPARAFLPAPGTLMRRIQMLRRTHAPSNGWPGRFLPAGILLTAVASVAAFGGPRVGFAPGAQGRESDKIAMLPAFDLSYVAPDALGVLAFRPAAAFELPGLKKYAAMVNTMIAESTKPLRLKGEFHLSVNDVEQIIGSHRLIHRPDAPEGQRRMVVTELSMIRTVRPFDWKKEIEAVGAELTEIEFEGGVYYRASMPFLPPMMMPSGLYLYMPDDRTLVINMEEHIKSFMRKKSATTPNCVWADGWKHVEHDLIAVAIDTRAEKIALMMSESAPKDEDERLWVELLIKHAKQTVFGAGCREDIDLRAFAHCETGAAAKAAVDITASLIGRGRAELVKAQPTNENGKLLLASLGELLDLTEVQRHGTEVHWSVKSKSSIAELLANSVTADIKERDDR